MPPNAADHRQTIKAHWEANRLDLAAADAWRAYDAAPDDRAAKALVADLLKASPEQITADRLPSLQRLLSDRHIDPGPIAHAGWRYLQRFTDLFPKLDAEPPPELLSGPPSDAEQAAMAERLEANPFARRRHARGSL